MYSLGIVELEPVLIWQFFWEPSVSGVGEPEGGELSVIFGECLSVLSPELLHEFIVEDAGSDSDSVYEWDHKALECNQVHHKKHPGEELGMVSRVRVRSLHFIWNI